MVLGSRRYLGWVGMILQRVAVIFLALMFSACGDMSWEQLTSFPDYSSGQQSASVPPEASQDTVVADARPAAPPPDAAPIAEAPPPPQQSVMVPVPHIAPPDSPQAIDASPMVHIANPTSYFCHQMAASAGQRAVQDGFDEVAQQNIVDTTLRQCLTFYGAS